MKDGELIKKYCDKCKIYFWVLAEIVVKELVEYKNIKE